MVAAAGLGRLAPQIVRVDRDADRAHHRLHHAQRGHLALHATPEEVDPVVGLGPLQHVRDRRRGIEVRLEFRTADSSGRAKTIDFGARDSGLFYFFNPNNAEMLVKVLNGCPVPGLQAYWVFYAATTDVEFTLTVRDTQSGEVRRYPNTLGQAAPPIQDTNAFTACP